MIEEHLNAHMEPGAVTISLDDDDRVRFSLQKPGYQVDLTPGGSQGLASIMGFSKSAFRVPAQGVFKEVSARLGNNKLVYAHFDDKIHIDESRRVFSYRAWSCARYVGAKCAEGAARSFSIMLPLGSLSPSKILAAILENNEHGALFHVVGDPQRWGEKVQLRLPRLAGRVILFTEFQSQILGGLPRAMPSPNVSDTLYYPEGLPNEVSERAGTNLFRYRYKASPSAVCGDPKHPGCEFQIDVASVSLSDVGAGIQSLEQVQRTLRRGLASNHGAALENAIQLYMGADDLVVLEVAPAGLQVLNLTASSNSLLHYLGFRTASFPMAGASRARASYARPLASAYKARGSCTGGVCACRMAAAPNESAAVCFDASDAPQQVVSGHACECIAGAENLEYDAPDMWGQVSEHEITFPDGIYSSAEDVNAVLEPSLVQSGRKYYAIRFFVNPWEVPLKPSVGIPRGRGGSQRAREREREHGGEGKRQGRKRQGEVGARDAMRKMQMVRGVRNAERCVCVCVRARACLCACE